MSMFEKEREGGGGGGGAICLRVKDWIICGLAERQLVCFVLEVLDRKQYLLLLKINVQKKYSVMDSNLGRECDVYISGPRGRLKTGCLCVRRYM